MDFTCDLLQASLKVIVMLLKHWKRMLAMILIFVIKKAFWQIYSAHWWIFKRAHLILKMMFFSFSFILRPQSQLKRIILYHRIFLSMNFILWKKVLRVLLYILIHRLLIILRLVRMLIPIVIWILTWHINVINDLQRLIYWVVMVLMIVIFKL